MLKFDFFVGVYILYKPRKWNVGEKAEKRGMWERVGKKVEIMRAVGFQGSGMWEKILYYVMLSSSMF